MAESGLLISFENVDAATANKYAAEMKDDLELQVGGLTAQQLRAKDNTMDFGVSLSIVLGSAAVTAVAKGIQAWLAKRDSAVVTIKTKDGQFIAKGVSASDARALVEQALKQSANESGKSDKG